MSKKIKTIDLYTMEFNSTNGHDYFSVQIYVNYGMRSQKIIYIPYQYGHLDMIFNAAYQALIDNKLIKDTHKYLWGYFRDLWGYCRDHGIILRHIKRDNQNKKDVVEFGIEPKI